MTARVMDTAPAAPGSRASRRSPALVEEAKAALRRRGDSPADLLALAKRLRSADQFDFACRILALAREAKTSDEALRAVLAQQHALCTYKNPDAPLTDRLDEAVAILSQEIDLRTTRDQESLGIAGAIFKRRWQADGAKEHLETSLHFYRRGFDQGPASDDGYTGINAAYVLDLLADIEIRQAARTGSAVSGADARRAEAGAIRRAIVETLLRLREKDAARFDASWWPVVTLAEACFGLEDFAGAATWLRAARAIENVPSWEVDSTSQQLAALARLQSRIAVARHAVGLDRADPRVDAEAHADAPGWMLLREFLGVPASVIHSAALGKVGLALSGGGFRASLFHIGVLAALAEHDLLRHVEALSCVSGGSIVGTHYYLELRRVLEAKADADITPHDYVGIVRRLEADFLAGVQRNIRMRVFANPLDNWRMFFSRAYSRTQKVGELYEREIYSRIAAGPEARDAAAGPVPPNPALPNPPARFVTDLPIRPAGAPADFHPRHHNWRRAAKVPSLVVNTSSLNSGHLWQFTGAFMGEPPSVINTKVDGNYRLRRLYYEQAPDPYGRIRLGHAVGASSCVPGLFEPLQFHDLFPGLAVTLVDGGVHDNQGVLSLLEQDCDHLIVSDASGQMGESDIPGVGPLPVLLRSDSIFQARMRDLQYRDLVSRIRGGVVTATYMHLKQGLEVTPRDWIGCDDPKENPAASSRAVTFTSYDVRKDVQRLLADVRTDLDSFCDAEAHALMTSGYRMTVHNLKGRGFGGSRTPQDWSFLYIDEAMRRGDARLMAILRRSGSLGFKVWGLIPALRIIGRTLMAVALIAAAAAAWLTWDAPLPFLTLGGLVFSALVVALGAALGPWIGRVLNAPGWWKRAAIGVGVGLVGWAVAAVHLAWFDRWYLGYGARTKFTSERRSG